jgi:IMP dehydrogenase
MQKAIDLYDKNAKELFGEFSSPNIRNSPGIKLYKTYRGMASKSALIEGNNKNPNHLHIEGEEFLTIYTGPVKNIVNKLIRGLQQGMFYTGSKTLEELKESTVIQITNAGNIEGTAHGSKL